MIARRQPAPGDQGSYTVELAAGLPALMLLLLAGLTAVCAVVAQGRCADAAREGALIEARGGPGAKAAAGIAADGARIEVTSSVEQGTVAVVVRAPVPLLGDMLPQLTVEGRAVAAREPGALP
ncbi:TadE family type IV pilus minor pilin [Actinoplanes sp. RD1]|uniref:TadE family type IV pilus minor pilin n=1 Tax=Actinoplanes sp. RD1 TaxID=3064538 RepID=UPI002741658A|nr:TadE family type IV pilus minor pilin [Actinoplanes sp. RD1]